DPVVVDAALSGARGSETAVLRTLLQAAEGTAPRDAAITMIAATIVRSGVDPEVQAVLAAVAEETRPEWQRSALMRGAEVALLGTPMPGTPGRRPAGTVAAGPVPCPTCPGGRAGPGGAYAFPRQQPAAAPYGGANGGEPAAFTPGNRTGPGVRLTQAPASFRQLAAGGGELAARATGVLARLDWPDKPGGAAPATPLTASERESFESGKEIYRNICQACHQPDGRGQDKVAPSLVGSALALGRADIPVRILLNGKEGPVGLMPGIGSVLTDEQIASVLTYVRRDWGQAGTPVDAAAVTAVRAVTTDRTRPWTNEELAAVK
ncbi:MAG: cytochrome c, partial [Acidobacteriota bacterium]|nr:cytochrome c [Acidobacteriota bacterium]